MGCKSAASQVGVVTGARSGIGAETCFALHELGFKVIAMDRRYPPGVTDHKDGLLVGVDVSHASELEAVWPRIIDRCDTISFLVNSAGVQEASGLPWETNLSDLADVLMTNALGTLLVIAVAVKDMARGGLIINIGSYAGVDGYAEYPAYSMSKGSLLTLARCLRGPLAERGLRLTTLIPGPTATPMQFEADPWPVLLHPATVAKAIADCLSQQSGSSVEELWIRAVGAGETSVDDGPRSRTWPNTVARDDDISAVPRLLRS